MHQEISLGDGVEDTISGLRGVVVAVSTYLNGNIKYCIEAQELDNNKMIPEYWLDLCRLRLVSPRTGSEIGFRHLHPSP